ncbi:MAG: hypothetical protein NVSMB46_02610 [Candidatus Saccharimonadales bacterium]
MSKKNTLRSTPTVAEQRQIENEVVFRKANEQIQTDFKKLEMMAKNEGEGSLKIEDDMILHFICECSDDNCRERIATSYSTYIKLHKNRSHFIVKPGHATKSLEKVIAKKSKYNVVDKYFTPPENTTGLNITAISNV